MDEIEEKETVAQIAERMLDTLRKQKAFVLAKAESIENRIAENGGTVPEDLGKTIATIRAEAA